MTEFEVRTTEGSVYFLVTEPELHRGSVSHNGLAPEAYVRLANALRSGSMRFRGQLHPDAANRLEGVIEFLHDQGLQPELIRLSGPELPPLEAPEPGIVY